MRLRALHRTSALMVTAFACVHIVNHLTALFGVASHLAFMDSARAVYRQPIVEGILLLCVAFQVVSGLCLIARRWKQLRGLIAWLQAIAGAYLSLFLSAHVGAILFGRTVLDLDTNFYFAAAGLHVPPYPFFFAPYYFLALLALFTHLGSAAYRRMHAKARATGMLAMVFAVLIGSVVSLLVVLSLAGTLQPFEVPEEYKAIYMRKDG
jgi:hypothetical protein